MVPARHRGGRPPMRVIGPVVCIAGPTASGKSALAEEVALRLDTSVISVDAMQVYRGMDVGTAKTPVAERRVPLLMVDVADPDEDYSVRLFQRDARACADRLLAEGRVPVLCGGTGLYSRALRRWTFPPASGGGASRERYERIAEELGGDALHALLARAGPPRARPSSTPTTSGGSSAPSRCSTRGSRTPASTRASMPAPCTTTRACGGSPCHGSVSTPASTLGSTP